MILSPDQLHQIFQSSPKGDLAELFSKNLIRAGEDVVLATSLSGRVRWFFLGKTAYVSKEKAVEIVARSVDAAMKSSALDPKIGKTIQSLANRIKKGTEEGLYQLPEPLANLQSKHIQDSIEGSTLFCRREIAEDYRDRIPSEELAPAIESRIEELQAATAWEREEEEKLQQLPREERAPALLESARALKESLANEERLFLFTESGTNGLSSEALIALFNQTALANEFRETWQDHFPGVAYPENLKGIQQALLSWLKEKLRQTVQEIAPSLPPDMEMPKWMDYLGAEGERELLGERPYLPEFLRQEINSLLSDGILSAISSSLERSRGETLQAIAKRLGSESELKERVIACANLFVEAAFNQLGEKEADAFERAIERLFEKLPTNLLDQLGLSDILMKKQIILRFTKEEKGFSLEMIHREKRIVVREISEHVLTEELFAFILKHKWAKLLDPRHTSDSELFEEKLMDTLGGEKEEQPYTAIGPIVSREDLELLYLMKTPSRVQEVKKAAAFDKFLMRITPLVDFEKRALQPVNQREYEDLMSQADQLLALFEKGRPEFATLTHFKKELKKISQEEPLADSIFVMLRKMEFTKEEIASHIDTLVWLFGNGYEPLLKKLSEKAASSSPVESDAPPLVYNSRLLSSIASGRLRIFLFLVRFNLRLAALLHTLEKSLLKAASTAVSYRLIRTFIETVIPAGILLAIQEAISSFEKWLLKKLLLSAARALLPSGVKLERQWIVDLLAEHAAISLNPKELDLSPPPPEFERKRTIPEVMKFNPLKGDHVHTGMSGSPQALEIPIDLSSVAMKVERGSDVLLQLHEILRALDQKLVRELHLKADGPFFKAPRLKHCLELNNSDFFSSPRDQARYFKLRGYFYPTAKDETDPFSIYLNEFTWLVASEADLYLLKAAEKKLACPFPEELSEAERAIRIREECFSSRNPIHTPKLLYTAFRLMLYINGIDFNSGPLLELSRVNLQDADQRNAFRMQFQNPLLLRMLGQHVKVQLDKTTPISFEKAYNAWSFPRLRDSQLQIEGNLRGVIPLRHPQHSLYTAMESILEGESFSSYPLLKPGVLREQIHFAHDLEKVLDGWETKVFRRALKESNEKLLSAALELLVHVKEHYAYEKGTSLPAPLIKLLALDPELCDFTLSSCILSLFAALPSPDQPLEDPWTFARFVLKNSFSHKAKKISGTALISDLAEERRVAWILWTLNQVEKGDASFKEITKLAGYPTTSTKSARRQGDLLTDSIVGFHLKTGELYLPEAAVSLDGFFETRECAQFIGENPSAFSLDEHGEWVTAGRKIILCKTETRIYIAIKYINDRYYLLAKRGDSFLWMHPSDCNNTVEETNRESVTRSLKSHPIKSLVPLTAFADPEKIQLEWKGERLVNINFLDHNLIFDVANGEALGRESLAGFRLAKKQQHPKLKNFPSYLLLENETGGYRALIANSSLYASPFQPLLRCLGPFEPLFLRMIAESSGHLFSQSGFTEIDISLSGEFLQVDPQSTLFLLTHALLSGDSKRSEELLLAFCSFAARETISVELPGALLIASLPYSTGSCIRLKVAAAIEENRLLRDPEKTSKEGEKRIFELGLLLFDLMKQMELGDLVTAREEYLLYQKLLKGISLITYNGSFTTLILQAIPSIFSERYQTLCTQLDLPAHWGVNALETAGNLIYRGAQLLPTLIDFYISPQLALLRLMTPTQVSISQMAGQSANRALRERFNLFGKTRWNRELFKPIAKVLPLVLSSTLFTDKAFNNWMRYFEYYKKPLAELPINEDTFWFFYKAALGELGSEKRADAALLIERFDGVGTTCHFAYIEILKTALEHPFIMPSWQKLKEADLLGISREISFLNRFLAAKMERPILRGVGDAATSLAIQGALQFASSQIPFLRVPVPLATTETVTSFSSTSNVQSAKKKIDEEMIRDTLEKAQKEIERELQKIREDLFVLSPAEKRSLQVLSTAEGTRLARSSAEFIEREEASAKVVAHFRGEETLYPALFRLQNLHTNLSQIVKKRKEALLSLIGELTGNEAPFHLLSIEMLKGALRKRLTEAGMESNDIDLIEWEWIATCHTEVNLFRTASILSAIEEYSGHPETLRETLFRSDFIPMKKWPRKILLNALMIENNQQILLWEKQVSIISELLEVSSPRILIEAIPGIGKTDVLSQIIEQIYHLKGFGVIKSTHAPIAREFAVASSRHARALKGGRENFFSLLTPNLLSNSDAMRTLYLVLKDAYEAGESLHLTRADLSLLDNRFFEGLLFQTIPDEAILFIEKSLKLIRNHFRLLADEPQLLWKPRDLFVTPAGKAKSLPSRLVKMMEKVAFELYQHRALGSLIRGNKLTLVTKEEYEEYKKEVAVSLIQDPHLGLKNASLFHEAVSFLTCKELMASAALKQNRFYETLCFYRGVLNVLFPVQMGKSVLVNYGIGKEGYAKPFIGNMEPKKSSVSRSPLETLLRTYLVFYTTGIPPELLEKAKGALLTLDPEGYNKAALTDLYNPLLIHAFIECTAARAIPYFPESIESSAADMVSLFRGYTAMTGTISGEKSFPGDKKVVESLETMGEAIAILQKYAGGLYSIDATTAKEILLEVLNRFFSSGKTTVLIDGGAELKGLNSLQVASVMAAFAKEHAPWIRGIRFSQKNENGVGSCFCWPVGATHPKPVEMMDLKLEEMWTYYSDLEGTGADLKLPNLDAVILVSDRSGLSGTSLDAEIQYCFRVRNLLASVNQTGSGEKLEQKIHFLYRKEAERAIFGDKEPSLLSLLDFNHLSGREQVLDDSYLSLEQQMKALCKEFVRESIFRASGIGSKRDIATKYRPHLVSQQCIDPVSLWGAPLTPADPHDELNRMKEQLASKLPSLRPELETVAAARGIPLPNKVARGGFDQDLHLLAEVTQEVVQEANQQQETALFQTGDKLSETPETDWNIKDPLISPKREKRVRCFSERFGQNDLPTARHRFPKNLYVTDCFLPLKGFLGSPYQRDLTELLIHGRRKEEGFVLESAIALSQNEADTWRRALSKLTGSTKEVAFLYNPKVQIITAGSYIDRELLIANRDLALFSATLTMLDKKSSYTHVEKEALLDAASQDYFEWISLFHPVLDAQPKKKTHPLQELFKQASQIAAQQRV